MISSEIEAGKCHNEMLAQARDTQLSIDVLPENMVAMLRSGGWKRLQRPADYRVFANRSIQEWILGPPWKGLGFPDWATVYAILEKNIKHGPECMKLLQEAEAPTPHEAEREFAVKLGKERGGPAGRGDHGRGRPADRSYNVTPKDRGNRAEYLVRRLARDAPTIFQAFERREYPSLRAACIKAGIVKVPSLLVSAQKAFERLDAQDRVRFRQWLRDRS